MIRVELLTPVKLADARFTEDGAKLHPLGSRPVVSLDLAAELLALGFAADLGPIEEAEGSKERETQPNADTPAKVARGGKAAAK